MQLSAILEVKGGPKCMTDMFNEVVEAFIKDKTRRLSIKGETRSQRGLEKKQRTKGDHAAYGWGETTNTRGPGEHR